MSRNYLNSQAFRDYDSSFDGRRWTAPPNTHRNPLSGYSEDYPDPDDGALPAPAETGGDDSHATLGDDANGMPPNPSFFQAEGRKT